MLSEDIASTISKLSARIDQIQLKIDHVNTVTNEAVEKLEAQKRDLRQSSPKYSIIQKNIYDIKIDHDQIVNRLLQRQTDAKARKRSYDQLDFNLAQLDREVSRIQADRDRVLCDLNNKREQIFHALKSTESLTIQLKKLGDEITLLSDDHAKEMGSLDQELLALEARTDLSPSAKELAMAELAKTIQEKEEVYQQHLKSLERQKRESLSAIKDFIEEDIGDAKNHLLNEIDELEMMKIGASPSELEALNKRIDALNARIEAMDMLTDLQNRGLTLTSNGKIRTRSGTIMTLLEAREASLLDGINIDDIMKLMMDERLKDRGVSISKSGTLRTDSGRVITLAEAKELGLVDENTAELLQSTRRPSAAARKLKQQGLEITKTGAVRTASGRILTVEEAKKLGLIDSYIADTLEASKKSSLSASTASLTAQMSTEDVTYLKVTVGKPLTLALAEICMKQPRDPIHYLGHWLFKYRYNQEIDEVKKREIEQLVSERERIRLETWHREVEDAARSAVLEMVFKAHDEAMLNELKVAERGLMLGEEGGESGHDEEENAELAEEAKDVLGEYTGPPAGQGRI